MPFTVQSVFTDVQSHLTGRILNQTDTLTKIQQTIYELTETYKFPDLQTSGPNVSLTQFIGGPYAYSVFMQPTDINLDISNIDSFFIFYQQPVLPLSQPNGANAGIQLTFKTFDSIELSYNIAGQTIYWTRYGGQIYFAFAPILPYVVYARYRKQQPFSNPVSLTDNILMPYSWQDIVGYAAAERVAMDLELNAKAEKFHTKVYGDPKFQATGGTEGAPGLIFMRTSQEQRDQARTHRQLRLLIPNPMR